ncbi:MAG: hypothetical protein RBT68_13920 [Spirochaetia bacterium]|nr:hypothetical protein [Spirochaetia bacterium]
MDSSIRVSAGVGLGALALSMIVAGFSRIPLGTLVLRAIVFGVLFAALTYLGIMLFRRYLPELFDDGPAVLTSQTGRVVDIVLPGEESDSGATPVESVDYLDQGDIAAAVRNSTDAENYTDPDAEVYSQVQRGPETGTLEQEVRDISSGGLMDEGSVSSQADAKHLRPIVSLDQLDVLPDLDGLSDAFSIAPDLGESGEPAGFNPETISGAGQTNGADPAALAKAVQTLLRRDQKGP